MHIARKHSIVLLTQLCGHGSVLSNVAEDVLVESAREQAKYGEEHATVRTMDDTSAARNKVASVSTY